MNSNKIVYTYDGAVPAYQGRRVLGTPVKKSCVIFFSLKKKTHFYVRKYTLLNVTNECQPIRKFGRKK